MPSYRLRIVKNHLLAELESGLGLIDTGSPLSFGTGELEIGNTQPDPAGLLACLSRELGVEVRSLIGTDILRRWVVLVDWNARKIHFEHGNTQLPEPRIRVEQLRDLGLPSLDIAVGGERVRALLDTGAWLSYADRDVVSTRTPEDVTEDFAPILRCKRFETPVYRFPAVVGAREVDVQWGVLPPALRDPLNSAGARWILGIDFFRDRRIGLDLANGFLVDSN